MPEPTGFEFRANNTGEIKILHQGPLAATLKKNKAAQFLHFSATATEEALQMKMAKLTGNYKHGNERLAKTKRQR